MFSADLGGYTAPPPAATDPPFEKVALLLHGDGTNGAQNNTFVDYSYPGGYAVSFDGTGDYLSSPLDSVNIRTAFTIESWCYLTTRTNFALMTASTTTSAGQNLYLNEYGGAIYLGDGSSNNITFNSSNIPLNSWFHCAVTFDGTTYRVFVNGVSQGSSTTLLQNYTLLSTLIGARTVGVTSYSTGYFSNFRVVKGTALYTSTFVPSNQPLTAVSSTSLLTCQSATIIDNSPNAYTITVYGNAAAVASKTITRTGNVAQGTFSPFSLAEGQWSNYFDGSGDYLTAPNDTSLDMGSSSFTVEGWFYVGTVTGTYIPIVTRFNGAASDLSHLQYFVYQSGSSLAMKAYSSTTVTITFSSALTVGNWYHFALVRDGNTISGYLNGVKNATTGTITGALYTGTWLTYIGFYQEGSTSYHTGYTSNVRVVKGTAVYTSNFTPSTTPLTAISGTSLLTCQSNRFKDNSSNNFTITRNGDTKVTAFSPFAPSAAYSASTNGGSGYFDGTTGRLIPSGGISLGNTFTVEGWFYKTNTSTASAVVLSNAGTTNWISVRENGVIISGSSTLTFSTTINLNTWNHVALVNTAGSVACFVNGVQVGSNQSSISSFTIDYIGLYGVGGFPYTGYVSNLRILNGTALYTSSFTPPTAPLTAVSGTQLLLNCTNAGIIDNSGKNDIETVGNAQISTSVKKYGTGSMYFDGTGDNLKFQNNPASTPFGSESWTIEGWLYPSVADTTYRIVYTTGWPIQVYIRNSTIELYISSSAGSGTYIVNGITGPASSIPANTWTHFAVVKNESNYKIYVNGIGGSSATSSTNVAYPSSSFGVIGDFISGSYPYIGYIDDLRITKGQALYTSNFTPPTQAFPDV